MLSFYFVRKYYGELAERYHKEKPWFFIIVGAVIYYAGIFLGGIIIFLLTDLGGLIVDESQDRLFGFAGIPFGILACYILYKYLEKKWKREYVDPEEALAEIGADSYSDNFKTSNF